MRTAHKNLPPTMNKYKEIKKATAFQIASKTKKYLGIHFTKE